MRGRPGGFRSVRGRNRLRQTSLQEALHPHQAALQLTGVLVNDSVVMVEFVNTRMKDALLSSQRTGDVCETGSWDPIGEWGYRGGRVYAKSMGRFPDGLDTEVFSFEALKRAHAEAGLESEREHVTPYIWKRPEEFPVVKIDNDEDLSAMRWTVDDPADFLLVTKIFEALYTNGKIFYMDEILEFLKDNPELLKINAATVRNEGYAKSLREDGPVNS